MEKQRTENTLAIAKPVERTPDGLPYKLVMETNRRQAAARRRNEVKQGYWS